LVLWADVARANSPAASGMPLANDAAGLLATDRSDIEAPGQVALRLDLSYVRSPLRIPIGSGFPHVVPNEVGLRAGLDVGVWKHLEAGVWIPVTIDTYSNAGQLLSPGAAGAATRYDVGAGDLRLFLKVNAYRGPTVGLAFVGAAVLASGDQQSFRSDGWGGDLRMVLDVSWRWLSVAFNAGARVHDKLTTSAPDGSPLLEIGSELTWAAAFAAQVHPKIALALEAVGTESFSPAFTSRARTAEFLLSLRGRPRPELSLFAGLGRALDPDSARGDDVRVILGMIWHPGGVSGAAARGGDRDGDGIPDDRDQCPREPEDLDGWKDDDGCPDPDNDGDGIPDVRDRCPNEPEDRDNFQDEDGCPDADNDGDGIPDNEDWCPNQVGPTDNEGCPDDTPAEKKTPPKRLLELPVVHFPRNSAQLDTAGLTAVGRLADLLGFHKDVKRVRLEGHASADEHRPEVLSFERAQSVMQALAQRGIDPERLQAVGYAARRPAGAKADENRRVEPIVIDQVGP
jgi:outer membrane protein OmpA-like peptidoglycan-associated protein